MKVPVPSRPLADLRVAIALVAVCAALALLSAAVSIALFGA